MRNPWPRQPPKKNMSILLPPGMSSENPERVVRAPGELSSDPVLKEWQSLQEQLAYETKIILKSLEELSERTGMPIVQRNGQRYYGPLNEDVPKPSRGSEVFIGRLPRNCYEPELVPILERSGTIYELRLMMNFSGMNRGYCFVRYSNPIQAERAVLELNNFEIRKGWRIGAVRSVDNCCLFIAHLPRDRDAESIKEELSKLVDDVRDVKVRPPFQGNHKNRGYAIVEFTSHRAAALARRRLVLGEMKLWDRELAIEWADPELEGNDLVIRNLADQTDEGKLWTICNSASFDGVAKLTKVQDHAYVSFHSHYQASMAKDILAEQTIDGKTLKIFYDKSAIKMKARKGKFWIDFNSKQRNEKGQFYGKRPRLAQSKQMPSFQNPVPAPTWNPNCGFGGFTYCGPAQAQQNLAQPPAFPNSSKAQAPSPSKGVPLSTPTWIPSYVPIQAYGQSTFQNSYAAQSPPNGAPTQTWNLGSYDFSYVPTQALAAAWKPTQDNFSPTLQNSTMASPPPKSSSTLTWNSGPQTNFATYIPTQVLQTSVPQSSPTSSTWNTNTDSFSFSSPPSSRRSSESDITYYAPYIAAVYNGFDFDRTQPQTPNPTLGYYYNYSYGSSPSPYSFSQASTSSSASSSDGLLGPAPWYNPFASVFPTFTPSY